MRQKLDFLHHFCESAVKYITVMSLVPVTVLAVMFQSRVSFDILEVSTVNANGVRFYVVLLLSLVALGFLCKVLSMISEKWLFWGLSVLYLLAGLYLITHIQMQVRYDSGICYWNALNYVEGIFSNLNFGEYFYKYPHQLGLVTYNCFLLLFSKDVNFVFFTNLLWILVTNFAIWQMMRLLYPENEKVRKITILLSFGFLPQFFYLFYAYGQVPGLGGIALSLYFTVRYFKKNSAVSLVFSFLFLGFACMVRKNYAIAGIAILLVYLWKALEQKKWIYALASVGVVCSMLLPGRLVTAYYENIGSADLSNGMPASLHVAMGLQEGDGLWRAAGWYNGFNDDTYMENNCDVEISSQIAMDSIKSRLDTFYRNPAYAAGFFGEKLITTWCEPTYQSIWSGPMISMGNQTKVPVLQELYTAGKAFDILSSLMNVVNVWLYMFAAIFIAWKIFVDKTPLNALELFAALFFVGGFLFHLVWETKSQYVYPYVVMLVPLAARGIHLCFARVLCLNVRKHK